MIATIAAGMAKAIRQADMYSICFLFKSNYITLEARNIYLCFSDPTLMGHALRKANHK